MMRTLYAPVRNRGDAYAGYKPWRCKFDHRLEGVYGAERFAERPE